MSRNDKIKKILKDRKIKILLHFTQLENLPSILSDGLKSKDELDGTAKCNDEHRLDNHTDTISLSIQHPNDPMFYKYRHQNKKAEWCVLAIPANVLLENDALFCNRNAATNEISSKSEDDLRKSSSLEKMFDEIPSHESREEQSLKGSDPTDVQAEILFKGSIGADKIKGIVFTSRQAKKDHQSLIGDRITKIHGENVTYLSRRDIQRKYS
jgi:hypothetical protein